nr:hypothetical protein [Borreliella bissettiae]
MKNILSYLELTAIEICVLSDMKNGSLNKIMLIGHISIYQRF